ncbi:Conserved_hypothetical protein [Hexamita inflata]|uniref:Uncharacterized protein n=1 Tax=Hexamita inflata TaxID=28002 RepID=A0AA86NLR2_9EUKA|nr:Conserved hypothetical protein [Hexamita inflata]
MKGQQVTKVNLMKKKVKTPEQIQQEKIMIEIIHKMDSLFKTFPKCRLVLFRNGETSICRSLLAGTPTTIQTFGEPPQNFKIGEEQFIVEQTADDSTLLINQKPKVTHFVLYCKNTKLNVSLAIGVAPSAEQYDFDKLKEFLQKQILDMTPVRPKLQVSGPKYDFSKIDWVTWNHTNLKYLQHPSLCQKQKKMAFVYVRPTAQLELQVFNLLKTQQALPDIYFCFVFQQTTLDLLEQLNMRCVYIRQMNVLEDKNVSDVLKASSELIQLFEMLPEPKSPKSPGLIKLPLLKSKSVPQQQSKDVVDKETKEEILKPLLTHEFSSLADFHIHLKKEQNFVFTPEVPFSIDPEKQSAIFLGVEAHAQLKTQNAPVQFIYFGNPKTHTFIQELNQISNLKSLVNENVQMFVILQGVSENGFVDKEELKEFNIIFDDQNLFRAASACYGAYKQVLFVTKNQKMIVEGKTLVEAQNILTKIKQEIDQTGLKKKIDLKYDGMKDVQQSTLFKIAREEQQHKTAEV